MTAVKSAPSKSLLQAVVAIMNREASYEGAPDMHFKINPDSTGIEFHLSMGGESTKIDAPITVVGEEIQISLPGGHLACYKREDLLDPSRLIWNN